MHSYRTTGENTDNFSMANQAFEDQVSLRSLPMTQHPQLSVHSSQAQHLNPPRSMSPVSSMSGDELSTGHGGRRSQRRRVLDKQVSKDKLFQEGFLDSGRNWNFFNLFAISKLFCPIFWFLN